MQSPFVVREAGAQFQLYKEATSFQVIATELISERNRHFRTGGISDALKIGVPLAESFRRVGRTNEASSLIDEILLEAGLSRAALVSGWALWSKGNLARQNDNYAEARMHLIESWRYGKLSNDLWLCLYAYAGIAECERITGNYAIALPMHRKLLEKFGRLNDVRGIVWALEGIGQIALKVEKLALAQGCFRRALEMSTTQDDLRGRGFAQRGLGEVALASGLLVEATNWACEAILTFQAAGFKVGEGYARKTKAEAIGTMGQMDGFFIEMSSARLCFQLANHNRGLAYCQLLELQLVGLTYPSDVASVKRQTLMRGFTLMGISDGIRRTSMLEARGKHGTKF
jgi:tetratricopeptide (TPR) repeat protein